MPNRAKIKLLNDIEVYIEKILKDLKNQEKSIIVQFL